MQPPFADCWYLSGPTASGKTQIGLELAGHLDAEIISLDSMALFREMDIGTAKPDAEQLKQVRHHLIDVLNPDGDYSISEYIEAASSAITDIRGRGHEVLFVGGTPLYLKALLRGLDSGPPADWEFRRQVEEEVKEVGTAALHARLAQVDPLAASKLHPNDQRRIIRALEVYRATGEPLSHRQTQFEDVVDPEDCKVFTLQWPREQLRQRIDDRVDAMFADGLVEEVRGVIERYGELSRTASQAVGYQEVIDHMAGKQDLEEAIQKVKNRTHRFARRQETWFRSLEECRGVPQQEGFCPEQVAEEIFRMGK